MIQRVSTLALIACLSSSLAFAGDKSNSKSSNDGSAASAETVAVTIQDNANPCGSQKKQKEDRRHTKPAAPDQDEQFNKVLQGIYG